MNKNVWHPKFLILHAAAIVGAILMPIYMKASSWLGDVLGGCIMHRFFIYCPLCGGTRAVAALVRLDFASAWRYNAFVVLLCAVALALDVWAWVRYFQKKDVLLHLPKWSWITASAILLAYWILRNYLVIVHGIDPTGDLAPFWVAIRAYFAA